MTPGIAEEPDWPSNDRGEVLPISASAAETGRGVFPVPRAPRKWGEGSFQFRERHGSGERGLPNSASAAEAGRGVFPIPRATPRWGEGSPRTCEHPLDAERVLTLARGSDGYNSRVTVRDQVIQELQGLDERQLEYIGCLPSSFRAMPSEASFPSFDPFVCGRRPSHGRVRHGRLRPRPRARAGVTSARAPDGHD
jgi:hypothetical protein